MRVIGGIIGAAAPNWTTWQQNRSMTVDESDEHDGIKQLLAAWWDSKKHEITVKAKKGVSLVSLAIADEIELPVTRVAGGQSCEYRSTDLGRYVAKFTESVFDIGEYLENPVVGLEVRIKRGERVKEGMTWNIIRQEPKRVSEELPSDKPVTASKPIPPTAAVTTQKEVEVDNVTHGDFTEKKGKWRHRRRSGSFSGVSEEKAKYGDVPNPFAKCRS